MTTEEINEKLFEIYRFRVPPEFAEIILWAYDNSYHSDGYYFSEIFQGYLQSFLKFEGEISAALMDGFIWQNEYYEQNIDRNYAFLNLPFEFFPFAEDPELGKIYGFIFHETEKAHIFIGECSAVPDSLDEARYRHNLKQKLKLKIDSPIRQIGHDTQTAFEFIFQRKLKEMSDFLNDNSRSLTETDRNYCFYERKTALDKANEVRSLFGKKLAENVAFSDDNSFPIRESRQFEQTFDGLGVYAPPEKFWAKKELWEMPELKTVEEEIAFIRSFLEMGFPATALQIIRDSYWQNFEKEGYFAEISTLWMEIYTALNRPVLANSVRKALEFRSL